MLGFTRTDNETLVACLGDPQRSGPASSTRIQPFARAAAVSLIVWSTPAP